MLENRKKTTLLSLQACFVIAHSEKKIPCRVSNHEHACRDNGVVFFLFLNMYIYSFLLMDILHLLSSAANANCKYTQIYCPSNRKCLDKSLQCNNKTDCPDGSDEAHCRKYPISDYSIYKAIRGREERGWGGGPNFHVTTVFIQQLFSSLISYITTRHLFLSSSPLKGLCRLFSVFLHLTT